jgi:hypothetical protein
MISSLQEEVIIQNVPSEGTYIVFQEYNCVGLS